MFIVHLVEGPSIRCASYTEALLAAELWMDDNGIRPYWIEVV